MGAILLVQLHAVSAFATKPAGSHVKGHMAKTSAQDIILLIHMPTVMHEFSSAHGTSIISKCIIIHGFETIHVEVLLQSVYGITITRSDFCLNIVALLMLLS